jgi:asparagine synthase (glutamine-hydrolysing)
MHNLQILDPTFDKNVLEFCFSIPDIYFRNKQLDRLIIRNAMKSKLPDDIRLTTSRGRQGSDIIYLISENQIEIKKNIELFQQNEIVNHFINISKMVQFIDQIKYQNDFFKVDNFLRCYGLAYFIHNHCHNLE